MIKMIAAVCRRPGMTQAEYRAYIQYVHGAISLENPVALRRYVQNHVYDGAFGTGEERTHSQVLSRDSITELYWDSPQDMGSTFAHEHVKTKVGPDGPKFGDTSTTLSMVAQEREQPVPNPGLGGGGKVMHFLRAAPGLALSEFFQRWAGAHEHALAQAPLAAQTLRRCVHNQQLPEFNKMLGYFGGSDLIYEGVASLWFADTASVGAFRHYERALLDINAQPATAFYQPAQSFFVYATEVPILQSK